MSGVEGTDPAGRRLFVGVGNTTSADSHLKPLTRAVSDVEQLAKRLGELGLETVCVPDPEGHGAVRTKLGEALPDGGLATPGGVLVLLWAGHAAPNANTRALGLLTAGEARGDRDAITPEYLADSAGQSSASQILILVDTCYSGKETLDVLAVTAARRASTPIRADNGRG